MAMYRTRRTSAFRRASLAMAGIVAGVSPAQGIPAQVGMGSSDELAAVGFPAVAPVGLPALPVPADSPFTAATFDLGRQLFFDPVLSVDRTVACATCHDPKLGFASAERFPTGVGGQRSRRHPPTLLNRGYGTSQRWDGSSATLEAFVLEPIEDPVEMGLPLARALGRLRAEGDYRARFERTYGAAPDRQNLANALASFVRGLTYGDTPVDRFAAGQQRALTAEERTGMWLFESKGRCWKCHTPRLFTDEGFHNTGVGVVDGVAEAGRMAATGEAEDRGRFKTPTLRGLVHTAPYMHDGSIATLEEVVEFYRRGGNPNPDLDPDMAPLDLNDGEAASLVAFLRALSQR